MMRGGTLLILGHGVKGRGQLWHFVYKTLWARYRPKFLPDHFQTPCVSCGWWKEEPYWFWVMGSKVKVKFGTLVYKTLWARYRPVFAQSLSNFTGKLFMMRGGTLLILGHGVKGQGQLWYSVYKTLLARYRPVFAQSLLNFTGKLFMTRGGTQFILGHGVKFQGQLWPPCEGMPRFVLSSLPLFSEASQCVVWRNFPKHTARVRSVIIPRLFSIPGGHTYAVLSDTTLRLKTCWPRRVAVQCVANLSSTPG